MSLLLDALRRAGNETAAARPSRPPDDTVTKADAGAATATAVFNSSEGIRRAERRRYILIALAALLAIALAAGAGWFYWQDLQRDVARDLPDYPPAEESTDDTAPVADGAAGEDAEASDVAADAAAAERVFDEREDTAAAIADAGGEPAAATSSDADGSASQADADDASSRASADAGDDAASSASATDTAETDTAETDTGGETAAATRSDAAGTAAESGADDGDESATGDEPSTAAADGAGGANGQAGDAASAEAAAEPAAADNEAPAQDVDIAQDADTAPAATTESTADSGGSAMDGSIVERSEDEPSELVQLLQRGYSAFRAGDYRVARRAYAEAVDLAPDNRDARLGAAAVAHQRGDLASARTHYAQILADDPDNPHAQSGLLAIDGVSDPRRAESALKGLLQDHPDSHAVQFALGNLYAAESRWGEAQSAYFEAYRGDSANANYAFNLAVALDHLNQHQAAHSHYADALRLARSGGAAFSLAAARQRMEQLGDRNGR